MREFAQTDQEGTEQVTRTEQLRSRRSLHVAVLEQSILGSCPVCRALFFSVSGFYLLDACTPPAVSV